MIDRLFENVTDEEIRQLIQAGEGPHIELRTDVRSILELAKLASAFANTEGGVVLVGVQEPNTIVGCNTGRIGQLVANLERRLSHLPEIQMHAIEYQGMDLAVIVIKRSQQLVVSDAGAFRRIGESNELITAQMMQQIVPQDEPPDVTNQHLREMLEAVNERLAAVENDVQYPRSWRGRSIALMVAFTAGLFARVAAERFSAFMGW